MSAATRIVKLETRRVDDAGGVLARAFHDDPMYAWWIPNSAERGRVFPEAFTIFVRIGVQFDEVYTTAGKVEGVALWMPPGKWRGTPEAYAQAGGRRLRLIVGDEAAGRFSAYMADLARVHDRDAPMPHWYLSLLGVEPARQGQGIGGALIGPVLARADADNLPCYLETEQPRNLPFYKRHGFEVVTDDIGPTTGLRFWTLLRKPAK